MRKLNNKVVKLCLAFSLVIGMFSSIILPLNIKAEEKLVNVAPEAIASTENGAYGSNVITNVNDGNDKTGWQTSGVWPSAAVLDLETSRNVSKIVLKMGGLPTENHRSVTATVKYAQNRIETELITIGEKSVNMGESSEFSLDVPVSATHIYVTFSNPKDSKLDPSVPATFYCAVNEIEIYEKQEVKLSNYNNIASQASLTTNGNAPAQLPNLVDGNRASLSKFHSEPHDNDLTIDVKFDKPRAMDAFAIYFEHLTTAPDEHGYEYTYSIFAKNGGNAYEPIVEKAVGNRLDGYMQQYQITEKQYTDIQLVLHSTTRTSGDKKGWPAIAEFEVYGSEDAIDDSESIAFNKPVHVPSNATTAKNVNDGSTRSTWKGVYYPAYVDIDLEENYFVDTIEVYTPVSGYSQYSIYTSMDGRDYDKIAEKTSKESATLEAGEVYQANHKEARFIRVYLEYNSKETAAVINEIRATGTKSNTPIQNAKDINVVTYEDSAYNVAVSDADTIEEVYGIVDRRLGNEYRNWFTFEIAENANGTGYDYFEITNKNGKINIKGNEGVSLAMGLNDYLKYYCQVNISQVGDQVSMPSNVVPVDNKVFKETKVETRYSYNYCTLSYSMAFWGEKEWRNELDWLALNGVNVVLDATGQEEVWRRFLSEIGYTHADIKDFIAGPAYYAWAYMANLSGFGGPIHDSWFEERTELARTNQLAMRKLGMSPALQGYSGMVPTNIKEFDPTADVIGQPTWCSFQRPSMVRTTSATFDKYAAAFYKAQKEVYGDVSDFYATDPFHEGGDVSGMDPTEIASEVLNSMIDADKDSIWIIQSWQGNPTSALLEGLEGRREHALVLDLYAEKTPHYADGRPGAGQYGNEAEFDNTPWVFCMLNNFGGRLGLHGHLDNLANNIPKALNSTNHMVGIGITPEASVNNPVLYDFIFETVWTEDATKDLAVIDLDTWLDDYATRRYGAASESANKAWDILKDTVYKASYNNAGQGAPESVVNARPREDIGAASTWGNAVIGYEKGELEEAAKLLLADYDKLKNSDGYMYDVANVLQQVLSNSAQEYQKQMTAAYRAKDLEKFKEVSATFLEVIDRMETVTGTSQYFLLGTWVEQAKALATNADDFTKDLYEFNAKALVTTWGSINQAETGGLKDYSNRQWSGLLDDFYKTRWQRWITARENELSGKEYEKSINWFEWEWEWARGNKEFTNEPTPQDLKTVGTQILSDYSVKNPAAESTYDIPVSEITSVTTGSFQPDHATEGDPKYVLDGNPGTIWHTAWAGSEQAKQYLQFTFDEEVEMNAMRFLQRSGKNGVITKFDLLVKAEGDTEWKKVVSEGTLSTDASWQIVPFERSKVKEVKLQALATIGDTANKYASAAEVRFANIEDSNEQLASAIEVAKAFKAADYTASSFAALQEVIAEAEALLNDATATNEAKIEMIDKLVAKAEALVSAADKTKLQTLFDEASNLVEKEYTSATWQTFKAKLDAAKEMLENVEATQTEVDEAKESLSTAKQALVKRGDKTALQTLFDEASNLVEKEYTLATWATFKEAYDAARALLDNVDATQKNIDTAIDKLNTSINALEEVVGIDKSMLVVQIEKAESIMANKDKYEADTIKGLEAIIADAKAVLVNAEANQEMVNAATTSLVSAIEKAVMKVDKGNLQALLDKVNAMDVSKYTAESIKTLKAAIANAEKIMKDENASQEQVEMSIKVIQTALDGLKEKATNGTVSGGGADTGDTTNRTGLILLMGLAVVTVLYTKRRKVN